MGSADRGRSPDPAGDLQGHHPAAARLQHESRLARPEARHADRAAARLRADQGAARIRRLGQRHQDRDGRVGRQPADRPRDGRLRRDHDRRRPGRRGRPVRQPQGQQAARRRVAAGQAHRGAVLRGGCPGLGAPARRLPAQHRPRADDRRTSQGMGLRHADLLHALQRDAREPLAGLPDPRLPLLAPRGHGGRGRAERNGDLAARDDPRPPLRALRAPVRDRALGRVVAGVRREVRRGPALPVPAGAA